MWKQKNNNKQSGLTLVEIMVAVTIISLAVSVILININRDFDSAIDSHNLRIVKMLATEKMEDVLLFYNEADPTETMDASGDFSEKGYPQFKWTVEEEELNLTTDEEIQDGEEDRIVYKITLTVTYKKKDATDAEYRLSTIVEPKENEQQ